jgi:hypothetical protein
MSISKIKEINKKFKKKFPLLRVYNCPDHEPDEHFCEDEVISFYTQQILSLIEELEGKVIGEDEGSSYFNDSRKVRNDFRKQQRVIIRSYLK